MPRGYQKLEINPQEVKLLMSGSKNKDEFRRYQAVYLRAEEKRFCRICCHEPLELL